MAFLSRSFYTPCTNFVLSSTFRSFSTAPPAAPAKLAELDMSKLRITTTLNPKPKPDHKKLAFGKAFTDHMFQAFWNEKTGWYDPQIVPYGPIQIYPSAAALHYGLECFEGMKAYRDNKGNLRLFRPDRNMERLNKSSTRLTLPAFNGDELLKGLKTLLRLDRDWIPNEKGYSVYIRPFAIATQPELGVAPVRESMLGIVCCPVGPYYPEGFKPVSLFADSVHIRAAPGGVGGYKVGGNYGPTVLPAIQASKKGFTQVLWLYNDYITEVGTMNVFIYWINEKGEKELMTPPLIEGTILPGVTRLSILELARESSEFKVSERSITMTTFAEACREGRILECFGAGTAAIVSPIKLIHYKDQDYHIPLNKEDPSATIGPLAKRFSDRLMSIQYGDIDHPWSVVF